MKDKPDVIDYLLFNDEHARRMREISKVVIEKIEEFAEQEGIEPTTTVRMIAKHMSQYHLETKKRGGI